MYFLLRFTPILSSTILFSVLFLLYSYPQWLNAAIGAITMSVIALFSFFILLLLLIALIFIGAGHSFFSRIRFYPFLLILWSSGLMVFFFSENQFLLWGLLILLPIATWIWLESLFLFWQRPVSYQAYTLEKLSNYLYLFALMLFTTAAIGLQTFIIQIPFWLSIGGSALVYFFVQYDLYSIHKIESRQTLTFAAFGTLLGIQLLLVLNLLPTHFFLYGLIIMLFYYIYNEVVLQLLKKKKQGELKLVVPIIVASLSALIVFFTTYFIQ